MKVHILDDWHDTLRGLPSFARLDGHEVTVWTDHCADVDVLAERLAEAEERFADTAVQRPEHWGGYRIVPSRIEFWQGQPNRLHDRFRYQRVDHDAWTKAILSP